MKAEENQMIPALLTEEEFSKYKAIVPPTNGSSGAFGLTAKDENSLTGVTIGYFCPSVDVKKSHDALRATIRTGAVFIPTQSDGQVDIETDESGNKIVIENFNLVSESSSFIQKAIQFRTFNSTQSNTLLNDEMRDHSDSNEEETVINPAAANKGELAVMATPSGKGIYPQIPSCASTPAPVVRSSKSNVTFKQLDVPKGQQLLLETGKTSGEGVRITGKSKWNEGQSTVQAIGPIKNNKWYPQKVERQTPSKGKEQTVERPKPKVRPSTPRGYDLRPDEEIQEDDEENSNWNKTGFMYDEWEDDELSRQSVRDGRICNNRKERKLRSGRYANATPAKSFNSPTICEDDSDESSGSPNQRVFEQMAKTKNRKSANIFMVNQQRRRSTRVKEVDDPDDPIFRVTKPHQDDTIWTYCYRLAADHNDFVKFYAIPSSRAGVDSVTRIMIRHCMEYGLVNSSVRGLRFAASSAISFEDFITKVIKQTGTLGSISLELQSIRFYADAENIYQFLFRILTLMRICYGYQQNDEIPSELLIHHLTISFTNQPNLRRFFSENLKFSVLNEDPANLDKLAKMISLFLADKQMNTKKARVNKISFDNEE